MKKIGDQVWVATFETVDDSVECPDCCGKKHLAVIMGDDSRVTVACEGCKRGYEPPTGRVRFYRRIPMATLVEIHAIEQERIDGKERVRYRTNCQIIESDRCADTKEEAMKIAERIAEEETRENQARARTSKHDAKRSWAWNATYHRDCIRRAKKDLEYHSRQLDFANEQARLNKKRVEA